jgi:hypothetical protein
VSNLSPRIISEERKDELAIKLRGRQAHIFFSGKSTRVSRKKREREGERKKKVAEAEREKVIGASGGLRKGSASRRMGPGRRQTA